MVNLPVREQIGRFKYYNEDDIDGEYKKILENLNSRNIWYAHKGG